MKTFQISMDAMYFYILIFLMVDFNFAQNNQNAAQIKAHITKDNAWEFVGIGGRYGYLKTVVSKENIIESDHFPPKSIYKDALNPVIKKLNENDLAAVSLRYEHHRSFITTNNPSKGTHQDLINKLQRLFQAGNYYEAIDQNIEWYRSNPDKDGNLRSRFDHYIKEGVKNALDIHIINGLITEAQKQKLIQKHSLNIKNPVLTNIVNLPWRDRAKQLVAADVERYKRNKTG